MTPFFAYPADIRRVIYTTNAVESLNMSLREVITTRGSFPNQEAAMKLLYVWPWSTPPKSGPCFLDREASFARAPGIPGP